MPTLWRALAALVVIAAFLVILVRDVRKDPRGHGERTSP